MNKSLCNRGSKLGFIKYLINTAIISIFLFGCGPKSGIQYFREVELPETASSIEEPVLKIPIDSVTAMRFSCYRVEYDDSNIVHISYLVNGILTPNEKTGVAMTTIKYDKKGHEIERRHYGADNKLIIPEGLDYATRKVIRDERNCVVEVSYYDTFENLTPLGKTGCAIFRYKFDENFNRTEISSYSPDEKLHEDKTAGVAIVKMKYDKRGNEIEVATYGIDGRLKIPNYKYHAIFRHKYDNNDSLLEASTYDIYGEPVADETGIAKMINSWDDKGHLFSSATYGTDGKLIVPKNGSYAIIQFKYDRKGNIIEQKSLDADSNLAVHAETGFAIAQYDLNEVGKPIEIRCYGADGKLINCKAGYARVTISYNDKGQIKDRVVFDKDGNIIQKSGKSESE